MQEFLGLKYDIKSSRRVKDGFRITTSSNGHLLFKFPRSTAFKDNLAREYMQQNFDYIMNTFKRLKEREERAKVRIERERQEQENYIESYLQNNVNSLFIFGKSYDVATLSVESLSQILYDKALGLLDSIAELMDLEHPPLKISYCKGYLGQCRRDVIKIDYRNVLSNEDLLSYLIVHELSHLRHMDHSPRFWAHVARYYPRYKAAKKELITITKYHTQILKHYDLLPEKLR
ncbi:DUF45 domain-containing protein [Helicobacter saguini]|uniref:DUF45 domain-containing protein n=1 Tax=Helicobacter saguini TaxID=1548018 RepID=A0A347VS67_9HELI|nr:M48 family metallopeptidase [Helicobacter saguini]MWV62632.1 DUF45 domain-containing protein [Helicobacter saguini]MWV66696.1 DUF45 domain-containing protein [Helicobacter saguini]MWV69046.1 DUF45 domain-containing protein [Helicobacter saguini]MWV71400.1 DUF45 domain-containing protein [Helicobacter saguini]TLD94030.1 M48 family peptidase [Helicobacter saguini]